MGQAEECDIHVAKDKGRVRVLMWAQPHCSGWWPRRLLVVIGWWGLLRATRWRGLLLAGSKGVGYRWYVVAIEHDCDPLFVGS